MVKTSKRAAVMEKWDSLLRGHAELGVSPERFLNAGNSDGQEFTPLFVLATAPDVVERSFRQGLALCLAGTPYFTALLYWRGHVFGVYRHNLDHRNVAGVMLDLKEFRLGWLPEETVRATGGEGVAFIELPQKAEGFPVIWFTGPEQHRFAGLGRMFTPA